MSEGNIDDRRSDATEPVSPPPAAYGAGQSAYPPPPPSIPSVSSFAGEQTLPSADAVSSGPSAPQTPASPIGEPGGGLPGYPAPGAPATGYPVPGAQVPGYPGVPVGAYPGGPAPQGYPAPGPQAAGYGTPGQPYATPAYPASGYPVQGYPTPGQPYGAYGAYPVAPPSGRRFWALQFLYYIPLFGVFVVLIVSLVQRSSARQSPVPLVRENARWAANWALSFLFYLFVTFGSIIALGIAFGDTRNSGVIAIPVVLLYAVGIYCLVTIIIGTVKADRFVHRPYLAIPFFRA